MKHREQQSFAFFKSMCLTGIEKILCFRAAPLVNQSHKIGLKIMIDRLFERCEMKCEF